MPISELRRLKLQSAPPLASIHPLLPLELHLDRSLLQESCPHPLVLSDVTLAVPLLELYDSDYHAGCPRPPSPAPPLVRQAPPLTSTRYLRHTAISSHGRNQCRRHQCGPAHHHCPIHHPEAQSSPAAAALPDPVRSGCPRTSLLLNVVDIPTYPPKPATCCPSPLQARRPIQCLLTVTTLTGLLPQRRSGEI